MFVCTGVRVHKSSGDIDILAPMVISDAGVFNTMEKLLPKEVAIRSSTISEIPKASNSMFSARHCNHFEGFYGGTKTLKWNDSCQRDAFDFCLSESKEIDRNCEDV